MARKGLFKHRWKRAPGAVTTAPSIGTGCEHRAPRYLRPRSARLSAIPRESFPTVVCRSSSSGRNAARAASSPYFAPTDNSVAIERIGNESVDRSTRMLCNRTKCALSLLPPGCFNARSPRAHCGLHAKDIQRGPGQRMGRAGGALEVITSH